MTIEEAKEICQSNIRGLMSNPYVITDPKYIEALNMAIASLEAWEKVKEQIKDEADFAYADFDEYKYEVLGVDDIDELPNDDFRYGMERTLEIINKHLWEVCYDN